MIAVTRTVISSGCAQQSNGVLRLTFPSPKNLMGLSQKAELRCNSRGLFRQLTVVAPAAPIAIPSLAGTHRPVRIGAAVRTEPERRLPLKPCIKIRADLSPVTAPRPLPLLLFSLNEPKGKSDGPLVFRPCVGNQTDRFELQEYPSDAVGSRVYVRR
jgi:hypothetical protein